MPSSTARAATLRSQRLKRLASLVPGLALAAAIAVLARFIAPSLSLPAVFLALVAGMLLSPFGRRERLAPGLAVGGREILRIGVALLGAQVTFGQLVALGPAPFAVAIGAVFVTLGAGYGIARALRLSPELSWLSAGAVAICGASAALAIAAVLPRSRSLDTNAAAVVAGITVIGTVAMLGYPAIADAAGLDGRAAGMFLGASLHEVVHAVGAGFSVSPEAGEISATVKLMRVACLAPVILLLGLAARRDSSPDHRPALLPLFVIGFLAFAALSSIGAFPPPVLQILAEASRFCLLVAIAALGTKVSLAKMLSFGARPLLALAFQTVLIAAFSLAAILLVTK